MTETSRKSIFWHRRDLRINDNAGLYQALKNSEEVQPVFIFDTEILKYLPPTDQRVIYIYQEISSLKTQYQQVGSDLFVYLGNPIELIPAIMAEHAAESLYTNKDYEPYAIQRDKKIYDYFQEQNWTFTAKKDQVIFEKNEILKADGTPYTIFTPYANKWRQLVNSFYLSSYPTEKYLSKLSPVKQKNELPSLSSLGFEEQVLNPFPKKEVHYELLLQYSEKRDFPGKNATSKVSLHLRFGTISIRELARKALPHKSYLNELIWRDFYQMIIYHFPYSAGSSFVKKYDRMVWENKGEDFKRWCEGKTGYPLVDAGMRELKQTGFMHNRVRMVVASFLCKHLLIDWRWGERYFAEKLLDFDLASNVGGWQWASGSGCDAAPYFRVFNPTLQQQKFDPDFIYIKKWIPEFGTDTYPEPIIEHTFARDRAISRYKNALRVD